MNLFCENVTLVHCSVVHGLQLRFTIFLYVKECVIISNFGSSVMWLVKRDKAYKTQAHCLTYMLTGLHEYSTLNDDPFTRWTPSSKNEVLCGRIVVYLSQKQLGYLTKYIIR